MFWRINTLHSVAKPIIFRSCALSQRNVLSKHSLISANSQALQIFHLKELKIYQENHLRGFLTGSVKEIASKLRSSPHYPRRRASKTHVQAEETVAGKYGKAITMKKPTKQTATSYMKKTTQSISKLTACLLYHFVTTSAMKSSKKSSRMLTSTFFENCDGFALPLSKHCIKALTRRLINQVMESSQHITLLLKIMMTLCWTRLGQGRDSTRFRPPSPYKGFWKRTVAFENLSRLPSPIRYVPSFLNAVSYVQRIIEGTVNGNDLDIERQAIFLATGLVPVHKPVL